MVAFVIFWASFFALVFFVLGVIFKALASAFNALLSSIKVLSLGALAAIIVIALFLLYVIVEGIVRGALLSVIGTIVMFLVVLGVLGAILGGLGAALLEFIVTVSLLILDIVSGVLEWLAEVCENEYIKFLRIIINRLDKC